MLLRATPAAWRVVRASLAAAVTAMMACGGPHSSGFMAPDASPDVTRHLVDAGVDRSVPVLFEAGTIDAGNLVVQPSGVVLDTHMKPAQQTYTAEDDGVLVHPQWSVDGPAALGTIDSGGVFTATGLVGGETTIVATAGKKTGRATVAVYVSFVDNQGALGASDQASLKAGGDADGAFRWLYPYDKTVFPRGLNSPMLQLDGGPATKAYVHMKSTFMTYDGFFASPSPTRVVVPQGIWENIVASVGAKDPLEVSVTEMDGAGSVTGPIVETWTIAQGSVHGTVYYTSYTSKLVPGGMGGTLKIRIGDTAPTVLVGSCNNCHSVAANGSVLAASHGHTYDAVYDLASPTSVLSTRPDCAYCLPAVYPDGSLLLSNYGANIPGMGGKAPNALYDTHAGSALPFTWLGSTHAAMPAFSPDGTQLVFNHEDTGGGHTLATAKFDAKSLTFSSSVDVHTELGGYPSWPQFTPDGASVIYHVDSGHDYATWGGQLGDMYMVDLATQQSWILGGLDGYEADGVTSYLPYAGENVRNFEPTVLPVAVGGYYWVVFTSRRYYGNLVTPTLYPDPGADERKKLWVAAIDIGGKPGTDGSHPAFYVDGQEFRAGNMRGFWVLDPCKQDGNGCSTADECCGGFCRPGEHGALACVAAPGGCSEEYESCAQASDCCNPGSLCIDGRCATPLPK